MRHFTQEEWADFARGVAAGGRRAAMQDHLDEGCRPCRAVLSLWQRIREIARRESSYEPPPSAVRQAKTAFARPTHAEGPASRPQRAKLLFDSFLLPQFAGLRSGETPARQLLYGAGPYQIDIRIEPLEDSEKAALIGQILNADNVEQTLAEVPVALTQAGRVCAEALTNRFGEFRLECSLGSRLQLRVRLPLGTELRVPVVQPIFTRGHKGPQNSHSVGVNYILPGGSGKRTRKKA